MPLGPISPCCKTYLMHTMPLIDGNAIVKCARCGLRYFADTMEPVKSKLQKTFIPFSFGKWATVPNEVGHRVVRVEAAVVNDKCGVYIHWAKTD